MKKSIKSSNTVFLDLILSVLVGMSALFFIAVILINEPTKEGDIDPIAEFMITLRWPDDSKTDMDLWVAGPGDTIVGFRQRDGGYMNLDRDDLGTVNDTIIVDGRRKIIKLNLETIKINIVMPGDYIINIHHFAGTDETESTIELQDVRPSAKLVYQGKETTTFRQEKTILTFSVDIDGNVYNMSESIQVPIYYGRGGTSAVRPNQ